MSGLEAVGSEQALLGYVMAAIEFDRNGIGAYQRVAALVSAADWYRPTHETIWRAMTDLVGDGIPPDVVFVVEKLTAMRELERVGGASYIHTLFVGASLDVSVRHHGLAVADAATRRRLRTAGQRIAQRADDGNLMDAADLVQWSTEQVNAARDERVGVESLTVSYREFLARAAEAPEPVVPGLLGMGDRMVLTGGGGIGKSTFLTQIMLCAAAGLPPLDYKTQDPYEPVRVSIFDCENPDHRRKTRMWGMIRALHDMGLDPEPNLRIGGTGSSFDLLDTSSALSLLRTVEQDKSQLVYVGPAYKLHNDDPDKEIVVKKITHVLDGIREMGAAVVTEAHTGKEGERGGRMSPAGSNLWTWWPEYGLGLRLDPDSDENVRRCKLDRWRLDRDASQWGLFVQSSQDERALPWVRSNVLPGYLVGEGDRGETY